MATEKSKNAAKIVKEPGIHEGHRDRMRQRFEQVGMDSFAAHEALEMLLYYAVPRRDTNEIAHKLLAAFDNSLANVFEASIEDLMKVEYISYNAAVLIKMIPALARLYVADKIAPREKISSADDAKAFFRAKFFAREKEMFMVAYLDNGSKLISCEVISEGTVNAADVNMSKVAFTGLKKNAANCIAAHNHPRGTPFPSADDILCTKNMVQCLGEVGLNLLDHVIVGSEEYEVMSMAESYRFGDMFKHRS